MIRRLDDTHVGEYKSCWWMNLISAFLMIVMVLMIFICPIYSEKFVYTNFDKYEFNINRYSPVDYLMKFGANGIVGYLSIALIVLTVYFFINLFLKVGNTSITKKLYVKIAKIIEIILALGCMVINTVYLLENSLEAINIFIIWDKILFIFIVSAIIECFVIKKVSIYD